jgi:hypothetical protein
MKIFEATWAKEGDLPCEYKTYTTMHAAMVPKLMAVDAERAFLGITKVGFENHEDGTLKTSNAELDQRIVELIQAVGDVVEALPEPKGPRDTCIPKPIFVPDIDEKPGEILISLKCVPFDCEAAMACAQ